MASASSWSRFIDTRWFIEAVDAAGLIRGSKAWTTADQRGMEDWFRAYLSWLRTSPNGKHEHEAKNNHGSWYGAQTAAYALFVGDTAAAREIVGEAKARIGAQITPQGTQPTELERTRSMHYSGFNVEALSRLAEMGRHVGIDLWQYQAPEGGSLRKAIDHIAPYVATPWKWPGDQIDTIETELFVIHLRRGNTVYPGAPYAAVLKALPEKLVKEDRSALLYPDRK